MTIESRPQREDQRDRQSVIEGMRLAEQAIGLPRIGPHSRTRRGRQRFRPPIELDGSGTERWSIDLPDEFSVVSDTHL